VGAQLLSAESPSTNEAPALLTNVIQVLRLTPEQARRHLRAKIDGVVTYSDPSFGLDFVQDQTAGIYVNNLSGGRELAPGTSVEVQGNTEAGLFSPFLDAPKAKLKSRIEMPTPRARGLGLINSGGADSQWAELVGIVQFEEEVSDHLHLEIASGLNRCQVWVLHYNGYPNLKLTDSLVRLRGAVGAQFDRDHHLRGFQVYVSSLAEITVLERPAIEAFNAPVRLARELAGYSSPGTAEHRFHVQGVVTLAATRHDLFIQDNSGGIYLETRDAPELRSGDLVDAVGFRVAGAIVPHLQSATVRKTGSGVGPAPTPRLVTASQIISNQFNYQLVRMEARLLDTTFAKAGGASLRLRIGEQTARATISGVKDHARLSSLLPGSELRVAGIWASAPSDSHPTAEAVLWVGSPEDIVVLTAPAKSPKVWWIAGPVSLAVLGAMVPLVWMRHRTRRHLEQSLQESERHLHRYLAEREQIGQDLHDNIIQSIYAVGLGLEDCRRVVLKSPETAAERLGTAVGALNSVIQDVRQFIGGLEPRVLNGRELRTALKSLALTAGSSNSQFSIFVDQNATQHLTPQQATHLLNIAKEAMSNSLRHAKASQTSVALQLLNNHLRLEVSDDGVGFDPKAPTARGSGLHNMAARAKELGSRLDVISLPGAGTRVVLDLPPFTS
jgi:signal transduction histidine kinase